MDKKITYILFIICMNALPLIAGAKPKVSNFVIGEKKFVIFKDVDVDDDKFKIDAEVAGNWNPEIGEAIRYYKFIRGYLGADSSVKINDTLDLCSKVQIQGTFDTTGAKKIYFQFILDPLDRFKDWNEKWFWFKEDVKHYDVYFNTETFMINSTTFPYGNGNRYKESNVSGEGKGKI